MMSVLLRIEMIVLALVFIVLVFRTVNKQRLQMRFSLVWLMISFAMMVVAIFPQIVITLSGWAGVEVPSNFLYLLGIMALRVVAFFLTVHVSKQADEIKRLTQMLSIETYLMEEQDRT